MITNIRKINIRFDLSILREKPIFEMLVEIDKRLFEKSVLKLKKRKKTVIIIK
tara:strand:- start:330 stop:488 length:159 start_codon:yes stop_codon:yes gene_type:complete